MDDRMLELVTESSDVKGILDAFARSMGISAALFDNRGEIVLQANWSSLCRDFHLRHPETRARCRESYAELETAMQEGHGQFVHTCANGLAEAGAPILTDGRCIGHAVVSQFFRTRPDREPLVEQAGELGFEAVGYTRALDDIPVLSETELDHVLEFLTGFARLVSRLVTERDERERACDRVEGQQRLFRSITECASDAVVVVDAAGDIELWNPAAEKIFGHRPDEAIGRNVWELVGPERHLETYHRGFEQFREMGEVSGAGTTTELVGVRSDGRELRLELSMSSMTVEGKWCGLGLLRDVTARTEAQHELLATHDYLETVLETVGAAIFTVDRDLVVTSVNHEFCEITGFREDEILGRHCHSLQGEPCLNHCGLFDPERTQPIFRKQCGLKTRDGRRLEIMKNATLIRDDDDVVVGGIESFTDVTDLVEATRNAEAAAIAKSQFLATMSHEIRTPLNAVIGMTELMLDGEEDDQRREELEIVRSSGELLLSIVNDILDLSKFEAGDVELESIDFDLRNRVGDVGDFVAQKAFSKGLELTVMVRSDVPHRVVGDPNRVRQVLLNLANNAVKFTEQGDVELRIDCDRRDDSEVTLRFRVIDSGIGIPADRLDRLFKPFSQVDASTTRKYGGTGLGLAICKRLVEAMGGEIGCVSRPGEGSEFWFTVPFGLSTERPADHAGELPELAGTRVLVVDDNEVNRRILADVLSGWGCTSREARNGREALDILADDRDFGAAILDYQMPAMNGADLAAAIKQTPEIRSIPLLLLTSMPSRGDVEDMLELGFEAYLTKPVRQSALLDALATVVGGDDRSEPAPPIVTQHSIAEGRRRRGRILLVEDNPINQKVACRMLAKLGHECDIADDGIQALDAVAQGRYSLVLMDCQMPEMDGYQATAEIRRREEGADTRVPIVAMTAEAMEGERERCLECGMDDYVSKPVAIERLEEILDAYLGVEPGDGPTPPVDRERLRASACDDPEFERELVELFLDELDGSLERIRGSLAAGDHAVLRREAHSLKGSAGNVGATVLGEACRALEMAARDDDRIACESLIRQLDAPAELTRGALRSLL